jgi:hypothetical protein
VEESSLRPEPLQPARGTINPSEANRINLAVVLPSSILDLEVSLLRFNSSWQMAAPQLALLRHLYAEALKALSSQVVLRLPKENRAAWHSQACGTCPPTH